jgi:Tol biopolymer transport system component/DNA-binding winged helix-turn-helix (wHTH) protein
MEMTPSDTPEIPHLTAIPPFRVGEWLVSPALCRVSRRGEITHLEPRIMSLLAYLASRPGQVFSRDTLLGAIWPDVVVNEEALTRAISELRRAFSDDPRESRIIETIRKSGYRLVAPVTVEPADAGRILDLPTSRPPDPPRQAPPTIVPAGTSAPSSRSTTWLPLASVVAVALALVWFSVWWILRDRAAAPPSVPLEAQPFTSYPGVERFPALSPDGARVAFVWDAGSGGPRDVYVKQADTDRPLRLTDDRGDKAYPTWSPDGGTIAFQRLGPEPGICSIPAIGGPEIRITTMGSLQSGLDWSPDGKWLYFAAIKQPGTPSAIMAIAPGGGTKSMVTHPPAASRGDRDPAISPDGRWLAFVRTDSVYDDEIHLLSLRGGGNASPRRLTSGQRNVFGLDWTPDGRSIVFSAVPEGKPGLWRLGVRTGALTRFVTGAESAVRPSISRQGRRLVYEEPTRVSGIFRVRLGPTGWTPSEPEPLIVSTQQESEARLSPDGSRVAFVSTRSGSREIWVCDRDGADARQLTRFQGLEVRRPTWSPDGRFVAFSGELGGLLLVHVVGVDGGPARPLARTPYNQLNPIWSHEPDWIHFMGGRAPTTRVERVEVRSGRIEAVLDSAASVPVPSADGRDLVFVDRRNGNLMSAEADGSRERLLVEWRGPGRVGQFIPVAGGVFLVSAVAGDRELSFFRYSTGRQERCFRFPPDCGASLTAPANGRTLLFDRMQLGGDLRLVEDFR